MTQRRYYRFALVPTINLKFSIALAGKRPQWHAVKRLLDVWSAWSHEDVGACSMWVHLKKVLTASIVRVCKMAGSPSKTGKVTGQSLWLTDSHKQDLDFMKQFPAQVVDEFARLAIEFLRQGPNEKFFRQAAKKLKVSPETVEDGLNSLGFLMLEAARVGLVDKAMVIEALTINDLGFNADAKAAIASHYVQNNGDLHKINATQQLTTPHYKDLEWRLDVQVPSSSPASTRTGIALRAGVAGGQPGVAAAGPADDPAEAAHAPRG
jgi:hypothetical protein